MSSRSLSRYGRIEACDTAPTYARTVTSAGRAQGELDLDRERINPVRQGISGAVLLLPFQVSVLGTPSPAVTPTNLLYNVIATPGALYRYCRQHQTGGRLALLLTGGTLPGVIAGSVIRVDLIPARRSSIWSYPPSCSRSGRGSPPPGRPGEQARRARRVTYPP